MLVVNLHRQYYEIFSILLICFSTLIPIVCLALLCTDKICEILSVVCIWIYKTTALLYVPLFYTDEMYEIFSTLPEDVPFVCRICSPARPAPHEKIIQEDMYTNFYSIIETMISSKCTTYLEPITDVSIIASSKYIFNTRGGTRPLFSSRCSVR